MLDPYNVIISSAPDANSSNFVPSGNDSIINTTTLQNQLATASVIIATGGDQAGNITVADGLT